MISMKPFTYIGKFMNPGSEFRGLESIAPGAGV